MSRFVEKLRVPVRLAAIGCEPTEGILSLFPRAELHDGPETLLERLNTRTRVVPFQRAQDDGVLLVTRGRIEWVLAGPDIDPRLVRIPPFLPTREEHVRVRLESGAAHEGVLAIEMPDQFNRVSDFLNGDEDFFPLVTAVGTMLISKSCVIDVRVRTAGAIPKAA